MERDWGEENGTGLLREPGREQLQAGGSVPTVLSPRLELRGRDLREGLGFVKNSFTGDL